MLNLQIASVELEMPLLDFETALKDCIANYSHSMNYSIKSLKTKHGKSMYKLVVDNGDNSNVEIVAEQDDINGNICFHPLKLANMNESFYKYYHDDSDIIGQSDDPCMFLCSAMSTICRSNKGSFACIDPSGRTTLIKDGSDKKCVSIGLIDSDGVIYSSAGAKGIKGASEDSNFTVNKPIGEWLSENPEVQRAIAQLPLTDKMNYIGKYLITAKLNEEIDADEFTDIFCQAGIFGFSDQSVLRIYKLIM